MTQIDVNPPTTGLDRYTKAELVEFVHHWLDLTEQKVASVRALMNSDAAKWEEAKYYAQVFGRYADLLPEYFGDKK